MRKASVQQQTRLQRPFKNPAAVALGRLGGLKGGKSGMTREEVLRERIEEYRKKIELYQSMIAEWEKELGSPGPVLHDGSIRHDGSARYSGAKTTASSGADPVTLVQGWQFFNKSQPEAAEALLEMIGHPMSTEKMVECLEKGGRKVGGDSPESKKQNLYTILSRSGRFGRVAKDTWGLPSWPGVTPVKTKSGKESKDDVENQKASEASEVA